MKTKAATILLAYLLLVATGLPVAAQSHDDESRICAIVAEQVQAWNVGDAKAFSLRFAEDGSFTNILGTVFYGHRAFEDRHAEIFKTFFKSSKLAMSVSKIRFLRLDVAIVDVFTKLSDLQHMPPAVKGTADGKIRTRLQEMFVRDKGGMEYSVLPQCGREGILTSQPTVRDQDPYAARPNQALQRTAGRCDLTSSQHI